MTIAIVKYNAGNVQSVQYALKRLGVNTIVTDDERELKAATKVIFPGVGHAEAAMQSLQDKGLDRIIKELTQPVLGICVGFQLMCNHTEEGDTQGIGIFDTAVRLFKPAVNAASSKVPQIGWNTIGKYNSVLFNGLHDNAYVYYVHSYYADLCANTVAETNYILPYSAALQKDNFYALQFHPEKSGKIGEQILSNFINLI